MPLAERVGDPNPQETVPKFLVPLSICNLFSPGIDDD